MHKLLIVLALAVVLGAGLSLNAGETSRAEAANCGNGPCLRVDVIPGGGIDESANVGPNFAVDIVAQQLGNQRIAAFNFVLLYDASVLVASVPQPVGLPAGFQCSPPEPTGALPEDDDSADGDPRTGDAFLSCFTGSLTDHAGDQVIARINFTAKRAGSSQLRLVKTSVGDVSGVEFLSCSPVNVTAGGGCTNGSVSTSSAGTPPPPGPPPPGPPPPSPPPPGDPGTCTVAYAIDGETVMCSDGSRLRFIGVGSPLGADAGTGWATALTHWFLAGKTLTLEFDATPTDQFGQRFAYPHVIGTDGVDYNISVLLIYIGMARHIPDGVNTRHDGWLGASQTWARAACWNMWGRGNPWGPEAGCF